MGTWSDRARQTEAEDLRMLEPRDRLDFERLLQGLRVSFLASSVLILVAFGLSALPYAALVVVAVGGSYALIALLRRYRAELLLRRQLWLRVFDCAVIYVVLVNYHAFLHDAYYDAVYVLFVVAAAATHGRFGAWTLSLVAGFAVLASRMQLTASGALVYSARHLTDITLMRTPTDLVGLTRQTIDELGQNTSRHEFQVETDGEPIVGLWDAGDDWAKLTVQDEGVGIPAADAPRIFEPFQRASNVVGRFSGTGIGLSGSRRIVERHGGTIEITSVEQQGTTVIVRLPLHSPGA